MTAFDLDKMNRAYVPEQEFVDFLLKKAFHNDYMEEETRECEVGYKGHLRMCNCLSYYNSDGHVLAIYNRDFSYGEIF